MPRDKNAFLATFFPLAQTESQRTGIDPRIIVAQAALESNWGASAPGNNYFGIKSHGAPGGNTLTTTEVVNGQPVSVSDSFRAYGSPADSVRGYGDFMLNNKRYTDFRQAPDLASQIAALGSSGYATDPNYADKISSIVRGLPGGADLPSAPSSAPVVDAPVTGGQPSAIATEVAQLFGGASPAPAPTGAPAAAAQEQPMTIGGVPLGRVAAQFMRNQNRRSAEEQAAQDADEQQRRTALLSTFAKLYGA